MVKAKLKYQAQMTKWQNRHKAIVDKIHSGLNWWWAPYSDVYKLIDELEKVNKKLVEYMVKEYLYLTAKASVFEETKE